MNENELMSSLPVPKAVAKMAIPSVISSILVTVVYNMADTLLSDRPAIRCRWLRSAWCLRQACLSHFYRWDWQTECSRFWDITMVLEITSGLFRGTVYKKMLCHCRHFSYGAVFCFTGADHKAVHQWRGSCVLWRENADRLHAFRAGHRAVICQYELYAVGKYDFQRRYFPLCVRDCFWYRFCTSVKCVYGVKRCHLRTGIDGLCSSYFVGCFMEENQKTDWKKVRSGV